MFGLTKFFNLMAISGNSVLCQQTRNTFVLKRKWPPPLHKKGGRAQKLKGRHFVYDLVEDTDVKKTPDLKIILTKFVEGVGDAGHMLTLPPRKAYQEYLLPSLAVYATQENIVKYKVDESKPRDENVFSSPYVQRTLNCLSRLVLHITMSKTETWTLEPWHVRASFRKAGFVVPEHAIIMPPAEIEGPNLSLQEKEFFVTVKVNQSEEVNVRCRIHHWATGLERLPSVDFHWKKPNEALIPEQAPILEKMPLPE